MAEVNHDLVVMDKDGKPYTVRYRMLTPMLVNKLQKEHQLSLEQRKLINDQGQETY